MTDTTTATKHALVIGASRNLGLGLAEELSSRGWHVVGTVRGSARTGLHDLASRGDDDGRRITVEHVDITVPSCIAGLRDRLTSAESAPFDLLFVNAGITDDDIPVGEVSADVFSRVLLTNAWAPMQVVETLGALVTPRGTIAVMSSRQGSIGMNERGGHEVYRASKSALNQLMRSYAARADGAQTLLLVHPGWVQTELGGAGAQLTVADSTPGIVNMLEAHAGEPGLQFRDYRDQVVPW
ncbi:3-oxoacyl-ACP reductase [Frondihabitans sp. PAMC 28766]|uniref:SDR family NAD(P)-dependent oxidoreductase n=1 Tax=Frondihabitans sp. PAMC 28766 TaxID=1795630 RepID=UPI00078B2EEF|nr:SDR family NAD(P)-dependent oxidoreductase [Frondihabitans sp. PAMC 28766]AMM20758.1 3-oxoacyl-ACP reductase [Frondihabitans sp. PAMC 28766]